MDIDQIRKRAAANVGLDEKDIPTIKTSQVNGGASGGWLSNFVYTLFAITTVLVATSMSHFMEDKTIERHLIVLAAIILTAVAGGLANRFTRATFGYKLLLYLSIWLGFLFARWVVPGVPLNEFWAVAATVNIVWWSGAIIDGMNSDSKSKFWEKPTELFFSLLIQSLLLIPILWGSKHHEDFWGAMISFLIVLVIFNAIVEKFTGRKIASPESSGGESTDDATETGLKTASLVPERVSRNFEDLYGYDDLKLKLLESAYEWKNSWNTENSKNGILLYGPPGTGKTAFAEALAGELKLPILSISIGTIKSRWVGQTVEQLVDVFKKARSNAPCVLFIDEIDAVIPPREGSRNLSQDEINTVNAFLREVDSLRKDRTNRVLLIGATNFYESLDQASVREARFDFRTEVPLPDKQARKGLMLDVLSKARVMVEDAVIDSVANRYAGFNVPRLREVARTVARFVGKGKTAQRGDFRKALRYVQGNASNLPENTPSLANMYLDDPVRDRLEKLATVFARADDIEAHGGKTPRAILFHGPAGTGKTTMAKVLAKESGYAFIPTTGVELSQPGMIEKIHSRASDLRPAIIFIDEAENAIGQRGSVANHNLVNELLARIDGLKSVPDVVWIAATNYPDVLDPAMTSRFTEVVELPIQGVEATARLVTEWAKKNSGKLACSANEWAREVAALMNGKAPRDIYGFLDAAYNAAVVEAVMRNGNVALSVDHVRAAMAR